MSNKLEIESSRGKGVGILTTRDTVVIDTETGDRFRISTDEHIRHEDNLRAIGKAIENGKMTPIK